jgi:hypothetical protein
MYPRWVLAAAALSWAHVLSAAEVPTSPRFEVSGVVIQEDGIARALVAEPQLTEGKVRMLAPGATIGPYTLVTVARDHIILKGPTETSLKVPFSWRSGGAGETVAPGSRPADNRSGSSVSTAAPSQEAPRVRPDRGAEAARSDAVSPREPGQPKQGAQAGIGRLAPPAGTDTTTPGPRGLLRPPGAMPAQPEMATGTAPGSGRADQFRRARDATFRRELSVDGYFYDKKKADPAAISQ